MDINNKYRII